MLHSECSECGRTSWLTVFGLCRRCAAKTGGTQPTTTNTASMPCSRWEPGSRCKEQLRTECDGERCQLSARHT